MNINPNNINDYAHKEWLNHPVTVQLLKNLDNRKAQLLNHLTGSVNESSSDFLRAVTAQLKECQTVIMHVQDTQSFLSYLKQITKEQ